MKIQEKAARALTYFTTTARGDDTIVTLKDDAPEWVGDMAYAAHGDMLPDDWRYDAIRDAVRVLADAEDVDEAGDQFADDVDAYTSDLTSWLHSRTDRYGYVDEAISDNGHSDEGVLGDLKMGQMWERREIWQQLTTFLADLELEEEAQKVEV